MKTSYVFITCLNSISKLVPLLAVNLHCHPIVHTRIHGNAKVPIIKDETRSPTT